MFKKIKQLAAQLFQYNNAPLLAYVYLDSYYERQQRYAIMRLNDRSHAKFIRVKLLE